MNGVSEDRLFDEHEKFLKSHGGEFLNCGWGSGPGFIHSKTTVGRLYSEAVRGQVRHWWTPGGDRGFSETIDHPIRARAPKAAPRSRGEVVRVVRCPHGKRACIRRIGEGIRRHYKTESRCRKCNWTSNVEAGCIFREAPEWKR